MNNGGWNRGGDGDGEVGGEGDGDGEVGGEGDGDRECGGEGDGDCECGGGGGECGGGMGRGLQIVNVEGVEVNVVVEWGRGLQIMNVVVVVVKVGIHHLETSSRVIHFGNLKSNYYR